jgi:hypothetical protein
MTSPGRWQVTIGGVRCGVPLIMLALVGLTAPGCGSDPFAVEDALGTWDLRELNGFDISGSAPTGVWIREDGGSDSSLVAVESIVLEFAAASACVWTFDDGIQGAMAEDDCQYDVAADGAISVTVAGTALAGTGEAAEMVLRDDATNQLRFAKRL